MQPSEIRAKSLNSASAELFPLPRVEHSRPGLLSTPSVREACDRILGHDRPSADPGRCQYSVARGGSAPTLLALDSRELPSMRGNVLVPCWTATASHDHQTGSQQDRHTESFGRKFSSKIRGTARSCSAPTPLWGRELFFAPNQPLPGILDDRQKMATVAVGWLARRAQRLIALDVLSIYSLSFPNFGEPTVRRSTSRRGNRRARTLRPGGCLAIPVCDRGRPL